MEIETLDVDIDYIISYHLVLHEYLSLPWYRAKKRKQLRKYIKDQYVPYLKQIKEGINMEDSIRKITEDVSFDIEKGSFVAKIGRKNFSAKIYESICKQIERYRLKEREKELKPEDLIQVISTESEEGYYDEKTGKLYRADVYDKLELITAKPDLVKWCREEDLDLVKGLIEKRKKALEKIEKDKASLSKVENQLKDKTI